MYVCVYTSVCVCVHVCMCVNVGVCVVHVVCTCMCNCLWVYYYLMSSLHLFPSHLLLTMQLPFLFNSPLLPLPVCFLFLVLFHCCPFVTNLWQHTISLGDLCKSQEEYSSNTRVDLNISSFIRFLSPITSLELLT